MTGAAIVRIIAFERSEQLKIALVSQGFLIMSILAKINNMLMFLRVGKEFSDSQLAVVSIDWGPR